MDIKDTIEKSTKEAIIKAGIQLLEKNPEENVDKIFSVIRKGIRDEYSKQGIDDIQKYYEEVPSIHDFIQDILIHTNKNCLSKFFANFVGNATWYGVPKRAKMGKLYDTKVPYTILISPSMRCNLRCTGCYAANYSKKDDIPFEEVDRLVKEARDLGIYYIIILGGEPFFNEYMLDIYEKYNDVYFTPFTNGTLFDEKLADRLAKLGNVMPMFSLEGFKEETDGRRGKGVFDAVMKGMDLLREKGIPFGVSSATGRMNVDTVTSDKFIDMIIEKGARMIWYFMFMPVGDDPIKDMDFMLTPEQRLELGRRTRKIRKTKKIFAIDFFNDAPYVGGCIAGKFYCHINSKEDVEPCIFSHFSTDNVKGRPLIEVFQTPYFKELRKRQPYNKNLLRPCPMVDNPKEIREIVKVTGAKPTHPSANLMVTDKEFMDKLDKLAEDFSKPAEEEFQKEFNGTGNYEFSKG